MGRYGALTADCGSHGADYSVQRGGGGLLVPGDMGRYGQIWGDMGSTWTECHLVPGDMGRYGQIWGDMGSTWTECHLVPCRQRLPQSGIELTAAPLAAAP